MSIVPFNGSTSYGTADPFPTNSYLSYSTCEQFMRRDFYPEKKKKIEEPKSWPSGKPRKPWEKGMK